MTEPTRGAPDCVFCRILRDEAAGHIVYGDRHTLAFLDHRPLFPGHTLVVPRAHVDTLLDLGVELMQPLLASVQLVARALETGLGADGSFVAANNRVSQSVPHLHFHVIPRRFKDGLKGFFWPRHHYRDAAEMEDVRSRLTAAVARLAAPPTTGELTRGPREL